MYSEGHAGLTLAISSLLMAPFGYSQETLTFIIAATLVSGLPDIDLSLQRKGYPIHHRGATHSVLAAILCGIATAAVSFYLYKTWVYISIGLVAGFIGIITHLLGDMLTHQEFNPLWPFREMEISLGLVSSGNQRINNAMVTLGLLCFVLYATK